MVAKIQKMIRQKSKNMEITLNNYKKLLLEIQNQIKQTEDSIIKSATRAKVVMAWQIGKAINEYLSKNSQTGYGEKLVIQLAKDISITTTVLYKMRNFYQTYPQLPKDEDALNWSHYRVLSGIKKADERKYLEDLTKQNNWAVNTLQQEINKSKEQTIKSSPTNNKTQKQKTKPNPTNKKLYPIRGNLFSYSLISFDNNKKTYIDCGFNIFKEIETNLKDSQIVDVIKKDEEDYSLKKSTINPKKLHVYKAYLDRVVDGDTIRVILDLGFKIHHLEILRLKGINAPEMNTDEGKRSYKVLNDILKDAPFLIIKSIKIDI